MRFCVAFAEMAAKQKEEGRASGRHRAEGHEYSNGMDALVREQALQNMQFGFKLLEQTPWPLTHTASLNIT